MSWTLLVILVCLCAAVFTIWLEYKRADNNRLTWRILAVIVVITALACIILPVPSPFGKQVYADSAVLLTENYNRDSITNGNYKKIFTLDKGIKKAYPNAIWLPTIQDIRTAYPDVKQLHVLGYGLDDAELQQLGDIQVSYTPPAAPAGVLTVNWQQQLKIGEPLKVQGRFNNTSSKPIKLVLKGLNTTLDSIDVASEKVSVFELNAVPKTIGRATYSLLATSGKDTLENESVPISIEPAKPFKVLILSAAPDFENKFLKDWLSQNGYSVALRATISKDKTSRDFANIEQLSLDNLSPALLGKFDVVISDLSTLTALSASENSALKQQVEQNGLGVIIRADTALKTASWLEGNFREHPQVSKNNAIVLHLQGQQKATAPLSIGTACLGDDPDRQSLVIDAQKNNLAAVGLKGQGKLIWATIRSTYAWMLAGNTKDYTVYWSLLINKAARQLAADGTVATVNEIAAINEPANWQLRNVATAPIVTMDDSKIAVGQNPYLPNTWNLSYTPTNFGWVHVNTGQNSPSWGYIYQQNDWKGIKNLKKIADTKKYSDNRDIIATVSKQMPEITRARMPKLFFYILLLAACTFLWAERKLTV